MMSIFRTLQVLFVAGATVIGTQVAAQTLFTRPDTTPNYAGYQYIDECEAAIDRVTKEADRHDGIWEGTTRYDPARRYRPRPAPALTVGQTCLAKLDVDTLAFDSAGYVVDALQKVNSVGYVFDVLLKANKDDDVKRLFDRWIATRPEDTKSVRNKWGTLFGSYKAARPVRRLELRDIYKRTVEIKDDDWWTPITFGLALFREEQQNGDTAFARQVGLDMIRRWGEVPAESRSEHFWHTPPEFGRIYDWLHAEEMQDSLTRSTAAYRRFVMAKWQQLQGDTIKIADGYIGTPAPTISRDAEFRWMGQSAESAGKAFGEYVRIPKEQQSPRPVPGRVNLVAFLQGGCHSSTVGDASDYGRNNGRSCIRQIAPLRRLKRRFPDVEITVVTNTFGNLGDAPPLADPSDEADSLAKFFLGFHRIPGTLAVTYTKFWRIPGIDNRRIDEVADNETRWNKAMHAAALMNTVIAIDETGVVFHRGKLGGMDGFTGGKYSDAEAEDELVLEKKLEGVFRRRQ